MGLQTINYFTMTKKLTLCIVCLLIFSAPTADAIFPLLIGAGAAYFGAPAALSAVGFTAGGIAAGSIAAGIQTASTAAGSAFAIAQSAGAAGLGAEATAAVVGAGAAAGHAVDRAMKDDSESRRRNKRKPRN